MMRTLPPSSGFVTTGPQKLPLDELPTDNPAYISTPAQLLTTRATRPAETEIATMTTIEDPTPDEVPQPQEQSPELATARRLLALLADTAPDPMTALIAEAALAHLDDVQPPLPPVVAAVSHLRGAALTDEAITALINLTVASGIPAVRARALSAMTELTMPLGMPPGAPSTDPGAQEGERR